MAPRQRIATPPSLEEVAAAARASTGAQHRPLLSNNSSTSASSSSSSDDDDDHSQSDPHHPFPSKPPSSSSTTLTAAQQQVEAADVAREQHDYFNLVALLFVVGTTLINWNFGKFLHGHGPAAAWTGQHFYLNWATTVLYFLVDLIWVSMVPICVKSPGVIVKHHIVAIAYLSAPLALPEYRWFMGACLSVEINTWFLILRRVVYKQRRDIWSSVWQDAVSLSFYASWIAIRCFIYPAILIVFLQLAVERIHETHRLWHWPMVFIPVHFFLCVLNLKWSYDLFEPLVRRWLSNGKDGGGPAASSVISSGL